MMPNYVKYSFGLAFILFILLVLSSRAILFSSSISNDTDGHFNLNCSYITGISIIEKKYGFYNTTPQDSVACPRILDFSQR